MNEVSTVEFVNQAHRRLRELRQSKHALNQIWGAATHHFEANPPIPEDEIVSIEKAHGFELPADYRTYLVEVGNGGAGPWQGLLPLHEAIAESLVECPDCLTRPFLHGNAHVGADGWPRKWFQFGDPGSQGFLPVPVETAMSPEFMAGSLIIARGKPKGGSAMLYRLVLTGPERGRVWRDQRAQSSTVGPCANASLGIEDPTFQEWMLAWLEDCRLAQQFGL